VVGAQEPVLIEAMTFRVGHHSTSDDSTRYRGAKEVSAWSSTNNPFQRFKKFLEKRCVSAGKMLPAGSII
jgi:2-oxoisovalerate dehydrogenase E1 component alpha subunit